MRFHITETRNFGDVPESPAPGATVELDDRNRRRWFIEITSLEELIQLVKQVDSEVIIGVDGDMLRLEVYNDYRE